MTNPQAIKFSESARLNAIQMQGVNLKYCGEQLTNFQYNCRLMMSVITAPPFMTITCLQWSEAGTKAMRETFGEDADLATCLKDASEKRVRDFERLSHSYMADIVKVDMVSNIDGSNPIQSKMDFANKTMDMLKTVDRTTFTQGDLYEIGSAMSLFQVKTYADEFRAALKGEMTAPPVSEDLTIPNVTADIEETTRDFVLKRLSQELKGLPLEGFIKHLLECMGYQARLSRKNEPSVDIIAHKDQLGIEPPIIKVQVKSGDGTISDKDVSALFGKLSPSEYGLFFTLGSYSPHCRSFEQSKANLRLIDGDELVELIFQHYEQFDSRFKSILPMRRIYVPELIDDSGE